MGVFGKVLNKMGYEKAESKTAGFATFEIEEGFSRNEEKNKTTEYKNFIDSFNTLPWLYAGATAIALAATKTKLKVLRKKGEDNEEVINEDINKLLQRPNPFLSYRELLQISIVNLVLTGNHYWNLVGTKEKEVISESNPPVELWWMKPEQVQPHEDPQEFIDKYIYKTPGGRDKDLDPSEVIHFKLANPDSYFLGLGAMQPAKNTAILELNAVSYNKSYLENDSTPPFMFNFPEKPTQDQLKRHRSEWEKLHKGPKKTGRFGYIWGGTTIEKMGNSPKDAQYIEMRKMNREELLSTLGVPPSVVGLLEYANYSNMEVQQKKFWEDAVMPVLDLIADKLTLRLAPMFDKDIWFEFDYSQIKVLQEDEEQKAKTAQILIENGIKTPNQVRAEFYNAEPYEGGDQYFMKMGLVPIGQDNPGNQKTKALNAKQLKSKDPSYWQDPARKKSLWDAFVKRADQHEKRLTPIAEKYLKAQADSVRDAIKRIENPENIRLDKIFDLQKEVDRFENHLKSYLVDIAVQGGEAGLRATNGKLYTLEKITRDEDDEETPFELIPELAKELDEMIINSGTKISETTMEKIKVLLQEGTEENWTVEDYAQNIWEKLNEFSITRSRRIARTESAKVDNWGQLKGYKQNPNVQLKGWLSAFVDDTREEHKEADAMYSDNPIPIDEPFIVGGEELQYPGDPNASAGNVVNCLCATYPEVREV